jgi:hypothetical protein
MYRIVGKRQGLVDADIESRGMGQQGTDIILSPAAQALFNHSIECKKHKRVVVPKLFEEHFEKYKNAPTLKLLFHENDRSEPLVTMQAVDFMALLERLLETQALPEEYIRIG